MKPLVCLSPSLTSPKFGLGVVKNISLEGGKYSVDFPQPVLAMEGFVYSPTIFNSQTMKDEPIEVDGLLGQTFLLQHCAIIDANTNTLYLMPLAKRDGPKLQGHWECIGGERDGQPLDTPAKWFVKFSTDLEVTAELITGKVRGFAYLHRYDTRHVIMVGKNEPDGKPVNMFRGLYEVEGDRLKLCLFDEPSDGSKPVVDKPSASNFESKKDSGHIYYEFKRVSAKK